jgi:hypothetical protein
VEVALIDGSLHHLQPVIDQDFAQPEDGDIEGSWVIDLNIAVRIIRAEFVFLEVPKRTEYRSNYDNLFEIFL